MHLSAYFFSALFLIQIFACSPPPKMNREDVNNMVKLAGKYLEKQDYPNAIKYAKNVLDIDFRNIKAYEILALSYEYQYNFKKALEIWHQRVFTQSPNEKERSEIEKKVLYLKRLIKTKKLTRKALNRDNIDQLKKLYKENKGTLVEPIILMALGDTSVKIEQKEKAEEYYRKIVTDFPDSPKKDSAEKKLNELKSAPIRVQNDPR